MWCRISSINSMDPYNDYEHHSRSVGIFPFSMHSMQCVVMTAECCTSKDNTNACPSCVWWRDASACAIQTFQAWEFMAQQSQKPLTKWNLTYLLGINNIYIYTYIYIYMDPFPSNRSRVSLHFGVITSCQGGFPFIPSSQILPTSKLCQGFHGTLPGAREGGK